MELKLSDIVLTLLLNLLHLAQSDHILSCNGTALEPCPGDFQLCIMTTSECVCEKGFEMVEQQCVMPSHHSTGSHSVTTAVVTVFMLVLLASGLILVVRKYNLIEIVRQKINQRRNNDVMYEDVMIGNDDPPLSP